MKKLIIIVTALASGLVALAPTASAQQPATITFVSVTGTWHSPTDNTPGVQPGDPVITNGSPTSSVSWGTTSGTPQSGYDFTTSIPPPFTLPGPIPFFSLGTFTHRNFAVGPPSLTSIQLDVDLVLDIDGVLTGPLTFSYTFNHDETPNNQVPCPYPTPPGEGCTDRVQIVASPQPTTFTVAGVDYTLSMNFLVNGSPVDEYITREGGTTNSSGLVGDFEEPPPPPGTAVVRVQKSGPATLSPSEWGDFTIDAHNAGVAGAFNVTLLDRLPDGPTGGMCAATPQILSAQVFESDGITPAPGKGPLTQGTDFSLVYDSATCALTLVTITPDSVIGVDERLIITYRAQVDADTQFGAALTNVAGATEWFNDYDTNPNRVVYARTLTDGTVTVLDHEDAYTVNVDTPVLRFEKTVANVTTGDSPASLATPGDTLRYSLLVENLSDVVVDNFSIVDALDVLNPVPAYQPGTLTLVTVPAGADISNTNPTGGAAGTGRLDVRDLSIGGLGQTVLVEFEVALQPVIADGTYVFNQSQLSTGGYLAMSDDPNVNGQADPNIPDDDDPTQILIASAPYLDIDKVSSYITGDPAVLLAGETLRYTITVANVGTDNVADVELRDNLPANTAYVAGSTTLNGVSVPDVTPGVLPLVAGIPINAPSDTTPGYLPADPSSASANVATIIFDVVVDPALVDGTIIENQAFVSTPSGGILDQPSDDPRTPVPDDPTRDVVGNLPLVFATKTAALQNDLGTPNVVDPGDTLRYTITVYNNGAIPATEVVLTDAVPANTIYVADSTTLNGLAVGQPDNGVSPLAAGLPISSSDLPPPGPTGGTLTAGQAATVQFDLLVDPATTPGTLIVNQATIASYELLDVLTDGDGNPATGPEPTVVLVGPGQQLTVAKQVAVVGGGPALAGATLEYAVYVRNIATVPASYVVITDDLDLTNPGYLSYVPQSATLNGATAGVTFTDPIITADYGSEYGDLDPGEEIVLRFQAVIDPNLATGTIVTNTANVTWNDPPQYADASVSVAVGGIPGVGILNGTAWHDSNFDNVLDSAERPLDAWSVDLYRNGDLIHTTLTGQDGVYRIVGVAPNYLTPDEYELRFVAPGAGPRSALLGLADSAFTDYLQRIGDIVVNSGDNLQDLNLPIDPNGVVYNSVTRAPMAGATLSLLQAGSGTPVPATCFDDTAQQDQVTLADGYYKFDLNFSGPGCSSGGDYLIQITSPAGAFLAGYSEIIPPTADASTAPLSVPLCPASPADAIPGTAQYCEAQPSEFAPPTSIAARSNGTEYYVHLTLDGTQPPGSAQIFNNHIPVDPELFDAVSISKTTPLINVNRGQLVPYTITVNSEVDFDLQNLTIADRFPAGFRYVEDSARIDGVAAEPTVNGRELIWSDLGLTSAGRHDLQLLLAVGAGISEGEYVNRAQAIHSLTGNALSGESSATVRLVPDPNFDCTDVMGKVYNDANRNGIQDLDEPGIGGARLVTARGLSTTTDAYGRFHITCAIVPREGRGSNFILKLDDRTLPSGFRSSTPLVRIERATRGKTLRFNFGASIHRVVGLDVADPIFEPGLIDLRPQWQPRINLLLEELQKGPATLRMSYLADVEDPQLVEDRVEALRARILSSWDPIEYGYELVVEPEVFWRRGGPPERSSAAEAGQ